MNGVFALVTLGLILTSAGGNSLGRSTEAQISEYTSLAAVLRADNLNVYSLYCGGAILNNRSILTSAFCVYLTEANRLRFRVGSSTWNSGGDVYNVLEVIIHEDWDEWAMGGDVAILRTSTTIVTGPNIQPGTFAGPSYNLDDNQPVRTAGWGYLAFPVWYPAQYENLREMQLNTVDRETCMYHYSAQGFFVPPSQICTEATGDISTPRDGCLSEPGAPLYHNNVVVGIRSYGLSCMLGTVPSISTRVSSYIDWISNNA